METFRNPSYDDNHDELQVADSGSSSDDFVDLTPDPSCLIESIRDIGYTLETAVADIIDN